MAAELITPTDELTGLPLPIAPLEVLPLNQNNVANWHHNFHPGSAPQLQGLGGRALRSSRIQLVEAKKHNYGPGSYHTIYAGPPLPGKDDNAKQFELCVLASAGYVPGEVIDLSGGKPIRRVMNEAERDFLRHPAAVKPVRSQELRKSLAGVPDDARPRDAWRRLYVRNKRQAGFSYHSLRYSYDAIRPFFAVYLIQEDMLDLDQRLMRRFINLNDEVKRFSLGDQLLTRAAQVATNGLQSQYRKLLSNGSFHEKATEKPETLAKSKLGSARTRARIIADIQYDLREGRAVGSTLAESIAA